LFLAISHILVSLQPYKKNNSKKMNLEATIQLVVAESVKTLYNVDIELQQIQIQKTKK